MTPQELVTLGREWGIGQQDAELLPFLTFLQQQPPLRTVIELGQGRGGFARIWLEMAQTRVIGVDLPDGDGGFSLAECEARNASLRAISDKFVGILGDSQDGHIVAQCGAAIAARLGADLLFIDADHRGDCARRDYARYAPFVRRGGWIVLHDINSQPHPNVQKFWDEYRTRHAESHEFSIHDVWGGIGVFRV